MFTGEFSIELFIVLFLTILWGDYHDNWLSWKKIMCYLKLIPLIKGNSIFLSIFVSALVIYVNQEKTWILGVFKMIFSAQMA